MKRCVLAFAVLLGGWVFPECADSAWGPERIGVLVAAGYEDRPTGTNTDPIDSESGSGDGRYWFAPTQDWGVFVDVWARWKVKSGLGRTKIKAGLEHHDWAESRIFALDVYHLRLGHSFGRRDLLEIKTEYSPQVYRRHRADKDAPRGAPAFRPEAYRGWEVEAAFTRDFEDWSLSLIGEHEGRRQNQWFRERDRASWGVGFGVGFVPWKGARVAPNYVRSWTSSRNVPDLGSDYGHDQHAVEIRLRQEVGEVTASIQGKWKSRSYTTKDQTDTSRFGRRDTFAYANLKLSWKRGSWSPFVYVSGSSQSSDVPVLDVAESGGDATDGKQILRVGFDVEFLLAK